MRNVRVTLAVATTLAFCPISFALVGCGGAQTQPAQETTAGAEAADEKVEVTAETKAGSVADGEYAIEVETDSSMFRAETCTLTVKDGVYSVVLTLPGEGFSRLYFGTAEDAAKADDADVYDYHLNEDGKYTFDLPVEALDKELQIAAFGQRRDTWYDHTIVFHAPAE